MAATQPVKEKESGSTLDVSLHPLVIINISDHYTRDKVRNSIANPRVIGTLWGTQSGRKVEILNSFELVYTVSGTNITLDLSFLNQRTEQFKQVYKDLDFLGWYSTGTMASEQDLVIHKQISDLNENLLYLVLDPTSMRDKEIPINIYETEMHLIDNNPELVFVNVPYKIDTLDAERIAVDHVAHSQGKDTSTIVNHLNGLHDAIKMLNSRIKIILTFLAATQSGQIPKDHSILRQIASLTHLLPAIDSPELKEDFFIEYNDALLLTYLASITKGTNATNELIEKFNIAFDKHSRKRTFGF